MTSHIRHRRGGPPPTPIEPGELAVDTVNRQLSAGNLGDGAPLTLLPVRFFDTHASYAVNDFAIFGGNIMRAVTPVSPGPFNPAQWLVLVGSSDAVHTPLHGYSDGSNHTLILHGATDDSAHANTIFFNNHSGATVAQLWTLDNVGSALRLQSVGKINFAAGFVGLDDAADVLEINPTNATVINHGPAETLIVKGVADTGPFALDFQNASGSRANFYSYGGQFWIQSADAINFASNHTTIDGGGTALRLDNSSLHVFRSTPSTASNNGALVVDGGAGIGGDLRAAGNAAVAGNINAGGSIGMGANSLLSNAAGYLVVQASDTLYLRSSTGVVINDTSTAPTTVGGNLSVNGGFTGVQGGTFSGDLTVYRSGAPATGLLNFGNIGTHYLFFDGIDLRADTFRGIVANDPVIPNHLATKNYVDGQINTFTGGVVGPYLRLAGGTMSGKIFSADGNDLSGAGGANSLEIGGGDGLWASMAFHVHGVLGTNFGLHNDGNFWMGGWSHGATAYKFWTTRELTQNPFSDVRLAFAADVVSTGLYSPGQPADLYPGAVVTIGPASETALHCRYRYLQLKIGSTWYTTNTVGP